jgi:hypothetical protein
MLACFKQESCSRNWSSSHAQHDCRSVIKLTSGNAWFLLPSGWIVNLWNWCAALVRWESSWVPTVKCAGQSCTCCYMYSYEALCDKAVSIGYHACCKHFWQTFSGNPFRGFTEACIPPSPTSCLQTLRS